MLYPPLMYLRSKGTATEEIGGHMMLLLVAIATGHGGADLWPIFPSCFVSRPSVTLRSIAPLLYKHHPHSQTYDL
jgi:hypothetical protein